MSNPADERPEQRRYRNDTSVLADIGEALAPQPTRIPVRLPRTLAEQAVAAWDRDEEDDKMPARESREQQWLRHRAGDLGLIGLAVQERGVPDGRDVVVELEAAEVAGALEAAHEMRGGSPDTSRPHP